MLRNIASNMTEIVLPNVRVLYSYGTPVAGVRKSTTQDWKDTNVLNCFKTSKEWSRTTSSHIRKYFREEWLCNPLDVPEVEQSTVDSWHCRYSAHMID